MTERRAPYQASMAQTANVPAAPPTNGSRAVSRTDRPVGLIGVAIPSRNRTVRRRVVALYRECVWLTGADVATAMRWAVLGDKFRRLAEVLDKLPVVKVSGDDAEPRKALGELRALSGEMTKLEAALGITAVARAALGVNVTRLQDLASAMSMTTPDGGGGSIQAGAPAVPSEGDSDDE